MGLQEEFAGAEGGGSAAAAADPEISQTSIAPLEAIGTPDRDILVKLVRQRGGPDNITLQVLRIGTDSQT